MDEWGWKFAAVALVIAWAYLSVDGCTRAVDYYETANETVEPCPIGVPARCIHARELQEARHGD